MTRGAFNRGEYDENTNPCLQVAPKGTWKIPSVDESKKLNYYELEPGKGAWFGPKERKRLFLPATGFRSMEETGILMSGETAYYQLSDKGVNINNTYTFFFYKTSFAWQNAIPKSDGNPIRCIKK